MGSCHTKVRQVHIYLYVHLNKLLDQIIIISCRTKSFYKQEDYWVALTQSGRHGYESWNDI